MKFLKEVNEPSEKKENAIEIKRQISVNANCEYCDFSGLMKGGETEAGKAVFMCPECKSLLWVKWGNIG